MKTSDPKARTARRFWSLLLSLVMVLALLPTAALADGTGPVSIQTGLPFTVKATDEAGNELAGVEIKILIANWQELPAMPPTVASATTNELGIATFNFNGDIPEGDYVLWQEALNFPANYYRDPYEYPITIAADGATPDGPVKTFINPSIMYDLTIPVEKIVTVVGEQNPASTEFWFQLWRMRDDGVLEELLDAQSLTADAAGKTKNLTFSFLKSKYTAGSTKLCLVEESGYAAGWTYSEEKYVINSAEINIMSFGDPEPQLDEDGRYHESFGQFAIVKLGEDGQPSDAVDQASFTNTYTEGRYEIPFTKTVKLGGNTGPGRQAFELEIFDARGVDSADGLYTATVETSGAGSYDGNLIISGPANEVENLVNEDFYVREKNTGAANWTYSDAVWRVTPDPDNPGNFVIYPTTLQHSDNGDYYVDAETPAEKMTFENTYTYNTSSDGSSGGSSGTSITVKKTDGTGAPLAGAVFALNNSRGDAVYKATSNSSGVARFTGVRSGEYTLVEQSAPEGYVKSEESYGLTVAGSRVTMGQTPYTPVTFVNYKEAELNRDGHYTFLVGYTDGTFGPERNMTRAEVTTMFARLLTEQIEADKTYANTFNDVPKSHWAADYIGYMQQFGIITGYPDGSFRPDAPVARAEFAAIASRFEELTEGTKSFADVPATYWAAKYINFAATRGWVTGYADGTFRPKNSITRAEVAAVTCRLLERTADQAYIRSHLDQLRTFRDMPETHWAYWYVMEAANGHDYTKTGSGENWSQLHP